MHYITFFCGLLEPETGAFSYVNAGHPPPWLISPDMPPDQKAPLLAEGGIPLGMLPATTYESGEATINRGDLLFLYTDGITEAEDTQEQQLGEDAVEATLVELAGSAPGGVLDSIQALIGEHTGGRSPEDDLTMVTLLRDL
jgi:sigma-B regulation protein RsbU (phosphoserine phosphatase)